MAMQTLTKSQDVSKQSEDDRKQNETNILGAIIDENKVFISREPELSLGEIEDELSLGHRFLKVLKGEHADTILYIDVFSARRWTGIEMHDKIMNIATALHDLYDFKQTNVVCINYDHTDRAAILALGVIAAGGAVACAYPMDPYPEQLYMSRKVEPKLFFCHAKHAHWGPKLSQDLGYEIKTILMDYDEKEVEQFNLKTPRYAQELFDYDYKKSKSLNKIPMPCKDVKKDVALIIMSSGTTGKPKAIPSTHWMCLTDFRSRVTSQRNLNMGCTQSLDYISGRLILFGAIHSGYTAVILKHSEPALYCQVIQDYKIHVIFLGAASFYNLMTFKDLEKFDISSLRVIFPMGAKITYLDEMKKFLTKHKHIISVRQGYGSSELSGVSMNSMKPEVYLQNACNAGQLLPSVKCKIIDPITGEPLGVNQQGILMVKSIRMFPGYYDANHIKTHSENEDFFIRFRADYDHEGFYNTGDIAYFDKRGDLYIVGRHKELMNCRASKKVLPQELEELIQEIPIVDQVCVLGMANKLEPTLHCPRAFIKLRDQYYEMSDDKLRKEISLFDSQAQLEVNNASEVLYHSGEHKLSRMETMRRRMLAEVIMRYVDERIGWEKQLTGGIVILDDLGIARCTGKFHKNFLRSLDKDQVEIYGDRSG